MKHGPLILRKTLGKRQRVMNKRASLWQAMRILRTFAISDLLAVCELPGEKRMSVTSYCGLLHRAGYLNKLRTHRGQHETMFSLMRNSGPHPPAYIVQRRELFDPNTMLTHSLPRKGKRHVGK
jgi:hypothetical protein